MKKVMKKRTGFTLVELLIVIIIIGILAGAMLLVAGSGTDKAEATKVVSDLRSLKAAALMYYADKPNETLATGNEITKLEKYMDREVSSDMFSFVANTSQDWYVGRKVSGSSGVKDKIYDQRTEVGLMGTNNGTTVPTGAPGSYSKENDWVWMRAR